MEIVLLYANEEIRGWSKKNRHLAWERLRIRISESDDRYSENMTGHRQTWLNTTTG